MVDFWLELSSRPDWRTKRCPIFVNLFSILSTFVLYLPTILHTCAPTHMYREGDAPIHKCAYIYIYIYEESKKEIGRETERKRDVEVPIILLGRLNLCTYTTQTDRA